MLFFFCIYAVTFVTAHYGHIPSDFEIFDINCDSCLSPAPNETFGGVDWSRRVYLHNMFSRARYYPECEVVSKPMIEVVYYHPGKRVELLCKVCHKISAYNGNLKSWKMMRKEVITAIGDLKFDDERWEDLNEFYLRYRSKNPTKMPNFKEGSKYSNKDPKHIPKTRFFQRDEKLIISHPHMDVFGLYYCRDTENWHILNHIYLLIPITPVYWVQNWKVGSQECKEETSEFFKMDEHHFFHFFPVVLPPNPDLCYINSKHKDDCINATFNVQRQPPSENITDVFFAEEKDDVERMKKKTNLKIFVHWSDWTSCDGPAKMRTRTGYCHIKKRDQEKIFKKDGGFFSGFPIEELHRLLENVEEFRKNGIMLFSGVMAGLLNDKENLPTHCTDYSKKRLNYLNEAILKLIMAVTEPLYSESMTTKNQDESEYKVINTLCFREILSKREEGKKVLHGHKLIQNEAC
ncbi:hypothetical protein FO519_006846 [Halicephalobus sp. NKZ332]|nr:hypothetical protein FO519_006846 [Halicephalobus sp. NKZ332]